ncbi:MAG TPA: malate synthase G [Gammaproteobacteria bacterium]|nr:malate synthase G [Gammaproteobacteria bacterium]
MSRLKQDIIRFGNLEIARPIHELIENEIAPGTGVSIDRFWSEFTRIVEDIAPGNNKLVAFRDELQKKIDNWHIGHRNELHDANAYKNFLQSIGYLVPEVDDFEIEVDKVDREIAEVAGPQLVVPLDNARYVLNAANARWGSLYDALYSSDAVPEAEGCKKIKKYNPIRGEKVIQFARRFLDRNFPLEKDTHNHAVQYYVEDSLLKVRMGDDTHTTLLRPEGFAGYCGNPANPDKVLLRKHGLHVELRFGEGFFIGRRDHAKIYDIHLEAAITSIMDCEDSVASVDTEDKIRVYRNWLGLMKGTLMETVEKDDEVIERTLADDREYLSPEGRPFTLPGRSLLLVRNVGMHLETDAVLYKGRPVPETILDAMVTALCAKHDIIGLSARSNSREGSVYLVKPKMHGPEEVALANELFDRVEDALGFERNTLKMGIMDEERRTSVNLKSCIHAARQRAVFINTGFLDRTGDDIHTNMEAGPVFPKDELKHARWLIAYEDYNVDTGLRCGMMHRAQIGKGMWAMPDEMQSMLESKILHLKAGATTAWVPSPTAATLHALHYHRFNVLTRQEELLKHAPVSVDDILDIPLLDPDRKLSAEEIRHELENNAQGILGYVTRWVGQGIGCSKVPDINNIALMEDCATLRISSQHIANWLHHGLLTEQQVKKTMQKMAIFVDQQNSRDPVYEPMSEDFDNSIPFLAALDLVFKGREQPNGYTEFILYRRRQQQKEKQAGEKLAMTA